MQYIPPKRRLNFTGIHGVIFHKIEFFIVNAMKTSIPKIKETRTHPAANNSLWLSFYIISLTQSFMRLNLQFAFKTETAFILEIFIFFEMVVPPVQKIFVLF
jgi:hypothetical protein